MTQKMKIWLDDDRDAPEGWTRIKESLIVDDDKEYWVSSNKIKNVYWINIDTGEKIK